MPYTGPLNNPPATGEAPFWEYGYVPSLAMGIVGCVTFLLVGGGQLWWFVKKRGTRSVHGLLFFACITEGLGYGARLYTHDHHFSGMSFLLGISLIQVATILISASIYKSIQRGLKYMPNGDKLSPMRIRSMLTVFIILDVVWVMMQIAGQYFWASAQAAEIVDDTPMFALGTSTLIFLAGNVLQAVTTIIIFVFCYVIMKRSAQVLAVTSPETVVPHIKPLMAQIMISLGLFFVRLIMRIAEGAQGAYENAATHEIYFGIFEYLPIFAIIVLWASRPLYKFIFPLGHPRYHSQTHAYDATTSDAGGSNAAEHGVKA
ncbi:uncharacterized protein I303_101305 [Kwoniella dejecticola CBS 10117]|uniref:RTA1 domain-containing protein n=1 Tax=Kwoniella dejecticola CBS 10117 TaxID=1296121 RepID=A0A1A6AHE9_9TREE|nr:uncharacterized protein I303_01313 [Kwoniella dejecticola CBS 10117]OBR89486.1 hypothetical protein I303_01313 [Kwoniella dejecticola CBS 10117]